MPVAVNDQGVVVVERNGVWEKVPTAQNDKGERVYLEGSEWKPVPVARPKDDSSFANKVVRSLAQVPFADEFAAAADATVGPLVGRGSQAEGWSNRYGENLDTERARNRQFAQSHPVTDTAAKVVGSIGATLAGGQALQGLGALPSMASTVLGRMGQGAAVGAGTGALYGFSEGENGFGNRVENAIGPAVVGGVVGGAVPAVAEGVARAAPRVADAFGLRNPQSAADRQLARAFERNRAGGGPGIDEVQAHINQNIGPRVAPPKPETLADLGGDSVERLAATASRVPSSAQTAASRLVTERNAAQGVRIGQEVARLASPRTDYYGTVDQLMQRRAAQAGPLYEQAFSARAAWSPRLQEFIDEPTFREGLRRGVAMLRREAVAEGRPLNLHQMGIDLDDAGEIIIRNVPNMRILDAAKRGIDDILEGYRDGVTGRLNLTPEGRSIEMLRASYLRVLDGLNPAYAQARAAYAGPSQLRDAMARGRDVLSPDAEITAQMVTRMSPSEREFFLAGVARAIRDKIENTTDGRNVLTSFFGKSALREKLQAAFPSRQAFDDFANSMQREANMWRVGNRIDPRVGSQTMPNQQGAMDMMRDPPMGALGSLAAGNYGTATRQGAEWAMRRAQGINSSTADALSGLYSTDPRVQMEMLARALASQRAASVDSLTSQQRLMRALAGVGGVAGALSQDQ